MGTARGAVNGYARQLNDISWLTVLGHLDLQVGARASACIALEAIEDAQPVREPRLQWRRAHLFRDIEAVNITPFDKPNLVLRLRQDAPCTIMHHGLERTGVRYVFLYLDRPERLLRALAA